MQEIVSEIRLQELADCLEVELQGDPEFKINGLASLEKAGPKDLAFLTNRKYRKFLNSTQAKAVLLAPDDLPFCSVNALVSKNPRLSLARIAEIFQKKMLVASKDLGISPTEGSDIDPTGLQGLTNPTGINLAAGSDIHPTGPTGSTDIHPTAGSGIHSAGIHPSGIHPLGIHPTATIMPHAQIAKSATIGPNAVIESKAIIGEKVIISANAIIKSEANIQTNVFIGPNVVIESRVNIDAEVSIGANSVIGYQSNIGAKSVLKPNVTFYEKVKIGKQCLIHSGVVLGSDGFGYAEEEGDWIKMPHLGSVVLGDNVEIGANTTIDRGFLEDTTIGNGVIIDNLVQVGHNVVIGDKTAIAGCVAIAGSTHIGKGCMIGGATCIAGHLEIGDGVMITAMTGINHSINTPGVYSSGLPAKPNHIWRKNAARFLYLDDMAKRIRALEKQLGMSQELKSD